MSALRRLGVPLGCRQLLGQLAWLVVYAAILAAMAWFVWRLFAARGCP
jgi:hypothetical protein